jgi:hypothetical protein
LEGGIMHHLDDPNWARVWTPGVTPRESLSSDIYTRARSWPACMSACGTCGAHEGSKQHACTLCRTNLHMVFGSDLTCIWYELAV